MAAISSDHMNTSGKMYLKPHSPQWYDQLAKLQEGYYYPWRSRIPARNGEDSFIELLQETIQPHHDLLEIACGHGELALSLASRCQSILAYDRVPDYIDLARQSASERHITNVKFICADSSVDANDGSPRIPANDQAFDILYSRRGPLHWLEDARRVARTGAILIELNPMPQTPAWNNMLPEILRAPEYDLHAMEDWVRQRLVKAKIRLHSSWTFDVPEVFASPQDYYTFVMWGHDPASIPDFGAMEPILAAIFKSYANDEGLDIRHRRLLWKAVID